MSDKKKWIRNYRNFQKLEVNKSEWLNETSTLKILNATNYDLNLAFILT